MMSSTPAARKAPPIVERFYAPEPEACSQAIEILLLKRPVKKAAGEDGGEEHARRENHVARNRIIPNSP